MCYLFGQVAVRDLNGEYSPIVDAGVFLIMSAFENRDFRFGFPFTRSLLRQSIPSVSNDAENSDLQRTQINCPSIADGNALEAADPASIAVTASIQSNKPVSTIPASLRSIARAGRPVPRQSGVRILPLGTFVWGSKSLPPGPRTRPDHTLIWVTQGRMRLTFPRDEQVLRPGDLRYIPAGTAFAAVPTDGAEGHVALIAPNMMRTAEPPMPGGTLAARTGLHGPDLLAALDQLAAEAGRADPATLRCLASLLSLRLNQLEQGRGDRQAGSMRARHDRPLLDRFLVVALARLSEGGSIADLADEMGTTTAALDSACMAARGRRAIEVMHDLRLERAVDLLRKSDQRPARIASDLGYSSHAHFTRAFVAATGRTPETFRAQSR